MTSNLIETERLRSELQAICREYLETKSTEELFSVINDLMNSPELAASLHFMMSPKATASILTVFYLTEIFRRIEVKELET